MDQAIQIATNQQRGTVVECNLVQERDKVFYHLVILSGEEPESVITHVLVSAVDGQIPQVKQEGQRKER